MLTTTSHHTPPLSSHVSRMIGASIDPELDTISEGTIHPTANPAPGEAKPGALSETSVTFQSTGSSPDGLGSFDACRRPRVKQSARQPRERSPGATPRRSQAPPHGPDGPDGDAVHTGAWRVIRLPPACLSRRRWWLYIQSSSVFCLLSTPGGFAIIAPVYCGKAIPCRQRSHLDVDCAAGQRGRALALVAQPRAPVAQRCF